MRLDHRARSVARCSRWSRYDPGMGSMSRAEIERFLSAGTKTGHLATVRQDGSPHVVPIWFMLDGEDLVFNTGATSVKAGNMRRDSRVSISVDLGAPPYPFVTIFGVATLEAPSPEVLMQFANPIGGRYMGADRAEEFGRRNAVPGELLVRVTPTKIVSNAGAADHE